MTLENQAEMQKRRESYKKRAEKIKIIQKENIEAVLSFNEKLFIKQLAKVQELIPTPISKEQCLRMDMKNLKKHYNFAGSFLKNAWDCFTKEGLARKKYLTPDQDSYIIKFLIHYNNLENALSKKDENFLNQVKEG